MAAAAEAAAPICNCPSAPMFKRPARYAKPTARPVNDNVVAFTKVLPVTYRLPKAPCPMT